MELFKLLEQKLGKYVEEGDFANILLIECKTLKQAKNLCKALDKLGLKWCHGDSLVEYKTLLEEWTYYKKYGKGGFYILMDFDLVYEVLEKSDAERYEATIVYTTFNDNSDPEYNRDCSEDEPIHLTHEKCINILKEIRRELR